MPELASIAQTDGLTVLDDVGDAEDLRVITEQELPEHMDLQWAKTAAEGDLLFGGDTLVTEHQQRMIEMGRWMRAKSSSLNGRVRSRPMISAPWGASKGVLRTIAPTSQRGYELLPT